LISNHAFEKLNLYKLTAGTYSDNLASQKAFLRAGYIEEAVIPSLYQSLGGGRVGRVIFGRVS
jgi:RimJ/RimL family protein N-acetyltransferase